MSLCTTVGGAVVLGCGKVKNYPLGNVFLDIFFSLKGTEHLQAFYNTLAPINIFYLIYIKHHKKSHPFCVHLHASKSADVYIWLFGSYSNLATLRTHAEKEEL